MSALLRPRNLTQELLRLDARKRRPATTLGAEPRIPAAVLGEVQRALSALADGTNDRLRAAVEKAIAETADGWVDAKELKASIARVRGIAEVSEAQAKVAAAQHFEQTERFNRRDVQRSIGISVPEFSAPIGERWRRGHIEKIKSLGEVPKARMVELLRDVSQKGTRVETLKGQIENEFEVNSRRARLIARDQILTLNANLTKDRHLRAGITSYKWRVLDGSARSNHKHLDGQVFEYSKPPMGGGTGTDDPGNPGDGIGCRCQAIPVITDVANEKASKEASKETNLVEVARKRSKERPVEVPRVTTDLVRAKKGYESSRVSRAQAKGIREKIAALNKAERAIRHSSVKDWVVTRTEEQRGAFSFWSRKQGGGYSLIRGFQRGEELGAAEAKIAKSALKNITEALETAPRYQGRAFRGMAVSDEVLQDLKKAKSFEVNALTSFSERSSIAAKYASEGGAPVVLEVELKNSRAHKLGALAVHPNEAEVLIQKGQTFRVVGWVRNRRTGVTHFYLSES